jgi:tRNA pseudouridine65 synthase
MEGTIVKNYRAVVRGHPPMHGTIDSPLRDDAGETSRPAYTEYSRMAATEMPWPVGRYPTARYALVELVPRTGRTHQLRRHMAHVRHPIVGDVRHGDGRHNRAFREHLDLHRLMLFATRLTFVHPFTGRSIALQASLPGDATEALARIGLG